MDELMSRGLAFKDQSTEEIVTAVVKLLTEHSTLLDFEFMVSPTEDGGTLLLFTKKKTI